MNQIMTDDKKSKAKQRKIKHEVSRLKALFVGVDPNKLDFVQRQIEQLGWYNIAIRELQEKIEQSGTLISYDNGGGQSGVRATPDLKTLMDYQKATNTIVRTLIPLVPDRPEIEDALQEFRAD